MSKLFIKKDLEPLLSKARWAKFIPSPYATPPALTLSTKDRIKLKWCAEKHELRGLNIDGVAKDHV